MTTIECALVLKSDETVSEDLAPEEATTIIKEGLSEVLLSACGFTSVEIKDIKLNTAI